MKAIITKSMSKDPASAPSVGLARQLLLTLGLALGLVLVSSDARAQNDGADVVSNAVVEAAANMVSNALVQLTETASTNDVATNDAAPPVETTSDTNLMPSANLPSSPQLGPKESRRQWLLRQRAGAPAANDAGNTNEMARTDGSSSPFRPVKPDYAAFKLVTERNIFDPNRVPHHPGVQPVVKTVESFGLVGIMSYEKGTFAFFDGNSSQYTKAVKLNDTIAGYKVSKIDPNSVSLIAGTNQVELQVGMQLRHQENGGWVPSAASEIYAPTPTASTTARADTTSSSADNDILERLRKKRKQE